VAIRTQIPTRAASIGSAIIVKDLGKATADFQTLHHSRLPGEL
jgi:CRISPR/Cas system-associated endonuclease Cas3-HD